jgi:hypothetical protein
VDDEAVDDDELGVDVLAAVDDDADEELFW